MVWTGSERAGNRGTILVASRDRIFADIVGEMVVECGFAVAYPEESEPAWLSVGRTLPCIAICDCDAPVEHVQRLFIEASAREIPLVLSRPRAAHNLGRALTLSRRVVWLAFPIAHEAFCALLDELVPAVIPTSHRATLSLAGVEVDAGVSTHTLAP
ncbi:MAG TPA: hypothetical protein VJ812_03105 [Gemmatimonadaceae bacterium]|nr:hypothetical protein [Gemmatimonadaceae bacterium]